MSADFIVRWAKFDEGDYGLLDPSRAEKHQYSARNAVRYNTGLLGVRPGLKALDVAWAEGTGTHPVLGPRSFDTKDGNLLITLGDKTYRIPATAPTPDPYDAYTAAPTGFVRFAQGDRVLYALINGDLWKHNDSTGVVTKIALPGDIKLRALVRWGYYLIGVQTDVPYRIWHSKVDIGGPDFDTWGANAYLDVGSNLPIEVLRPIYNTLYAGKRDGWWAVSGILGEQSAVRARTIGNGPCCERQTAVTTNNRIVYWAHDDAPTWFDGDQARQDRDFQISGFDTSFPGDAVVATPNGNRVAMLGERTGQTGDVIQSGMLLSKDGNWSTHVFDMPIGALAGHDSRNATGMPDGVLFMCRRPLIVGEAVEIVSLDVGMERPAHADDDWAAPTDSGSTDLVTGSVDLPAHWELQGRFMRVTSVIVQFRKWPSGVAGTRNTLRCKVVPLGLHDGGTIDTEIKVWDESSDRADRVGTDDSVRFNLDTDFSRGFQVTFPTLRGVALREVIAEVEVRTTR